MSQPISVSVQMDAASFHDFAAFDLLRHRKAWHRPLAFTAILLAAAPTATPCFRHWQRSSPLPIEERPWHSGKLSLFARGSPR